MLKRLMLSGVAGLLTQAVVFLILYPLVLVTDSDLVFIALVLLLPGFALASIEGSAVSLAAALSINLVLYAPPCFVVLYLSEERRKKNRLKRMLDVNSDSEIISIAAWMKAPCGEGVAESHRKGNQPAGG